MRIATWRKKCRTTIVAKESEKWRRKRKGGKFKKLSTENWKKIAGNPRVTQSGALNPPLNTSHVATTCLAPPLHNECEEKPQETRLSKKKKKLFASWWSSRHARMTTELWEGSWWDWRTLLLTRTNQTSSSTSPCHWRTEESHLM